MASFILRKIDPEFWAQVKSKAAADRISLYALILRLLALYLRVGLAALERVD